MKKRARSTSILFVVAVAGCLVVLPAAVAVASSCSCGSHDLGSESKAQSKAAVDKKDVAKKIENYIKEDKKAKGGYFLLYDEKNDKPLALTLKGVHKDMVMDAGEGKYFACADFVDTSGKVYDVDILVKHSSAHGLHVSEVAIHKEGDQHRYKWHKTEHGMEKKHVEQ